MCNFFIYISSISLTKAIGGVEKIEQHVIDFVRSLRIENNLRQEDIAYILDVKPSFIGNVESSSHAAKYNLKHINKLADHFGISPRDFLPKQSL